MAGNLLKDLNSQQIKATTFGEGPLLILAGAGSGKTRTIVYRVAYLIHEKGVQPDRILLTTFTNKAAHEMRERLLRLVGSAPPFCGTFHSLCAKVLRKHGKHLGISPSYLIYDERDQEDLIKQAMMNLDISARDFKPRSVLATISSAKNELVGPTEYPQFARGRWQETVSSIYLEYQKLLRHSDALDFDDLLMDTVRLLQKESFVLSTYQDQFQYVLVDEYQDTNHAQYVLTKLLVNKWRNLCCVGDASQSIYAWRGADFRNLTRIREDFSDLTVINLERNYRSTQNILDAAHGVISNNTSHPILSLWTKRKGGEAISIFEALDEKDEAHFILRTIQEYIDLGHHYRDFAILYRTNAQSRTFEEAFVRAGIPYVLIGGTRFYQRKEVKDCLAYLRLLANPNDTVSAGRIEKLGKRKFSLFQEFAQQFRSKKQHIEMATSEILEQVFKTTDYLDRYDSEDEEELMRLENIKELHSVAAEFPLLLDFLENVALVEQEQLPHINLQTQGKQDVVTMMTLHSAKGLEFPVVFLVGMEEGLFPHSRSMLDRDELEEERRLCYVGITRAKDRLFFTFASQRLYFGSRSSNVVSRFMGEVPEHLIRVVTL